MKDPRDAVGPRFASAANYRIVVRGNLDRGWSDRLAGLSIEHTSSAGGDERTMLTGRVRDQAELHGVIQALYGLHLPILEVHRLADEQEHPETAASLSSVAIPKTGMSVPPNGTKEEV